METESGMWARNVCAQRGIILTCITTIQNFLLLVVMEMTMHTGNALALDALQSRALSRVSNAEERNVYVRAY